MCGPDCNRPKMLRIDSPIDLEDGVNLVDGTKAVIYQNPAKLIKDEYFIEWFRLLSLCHQFKSMPRSGGVLSQTTEFIEMYDTFSFWTKYKEDRDKQQER